MKKLNKIVKEDILNEMDYQKLIPIQVNNLMIAFSAVRQANALGDTKKVKRTFMGAVKLMKQMKTSIDKLDG